MLAQKVRVMIPDDHQLKVRVPDEVPPGPAEVIFIPDAAQARPFNEAEDIEDEEHVQRMSLREAAREILEISDECYSSSRGRKWTREELYER